MNHSTTLPLLVLTLLAGTSVLQAAPGAESTAQRLMVYVGTYTRGESRGIYRYWLDLETGKLSYVGVTPGVVNPSFLAIHPNRPFLYAVSEIAGFGGKRTGAIRAFAVEGEEGALRPLNTQPSGGAGPCYLVVDRKGKNVLAANYSGGSVAVLPIGDDGRLGQATAVVQHEGSSVNPKRQRGPHAHSITLDAANRFAFAADLGLDKILVYRFDAAEGTLLPNDPPGVSAALGAGPRHFAFHPDGRHAYVINEMDCTVTTFDYDATRGVLKPLASISTLPQGFDGPNTTAEIQVHPSGRFVYGSNRGHDSIVVFSVDPDSGKLRCVAHQSTRGKTPRNFEIDPTGKWLLAANGGSDTIVVFRIDPQTGDLEPIDEVVSVPMPVCIKMMRKPR